MQSSLKTDHDLAFVLLNEEGTILDAHPSCDVALGWDRDEVLGKNLADLIQCGQEVLLRQIANAEDSADPTQTSFVVRVLGRRKDGTNYRAAATARRFTELGCWTVTFDLTTAADEGRSPIVRPEEINLAMRNARKPAERKPEPPMRTTEPAPQSPKNGPLRNKDLLFSMRSTPAAAESPAAPQMPQTDGHLAGQPATELDRERADRKRAESRLQALAAQLQQLHQQLGENLESERNGQARMADLEEQVAASVASLADARRLVEAEKAQRKLAEEQCQAFGEFRERATANWAGFETAKGEWIKANQNLMERLESKNGEITALEERVRSEATERQKLQEALACAERARSTAVEKKELELLALRSEVEARRLEIRRLEEEASKARFSSIEAERSSQEQISRWRETQQHTIGEINTALDEFPLADEQQQASILESIRAKLDRLKEGASTPAVGAAASVS